MLFMWFLLALKKDVAFTEDATEHYKNVGAGVDFKKKYPNMPFDESMSGRYCVWSFQFDSRIVR